MRKEAAEIDDLTPLFRSFSGGNTVAVPGGRSTERDYGAGLAGGTAAWGQWRPAPQGPMPGGSRVRISLNLAAE